ncbi:MAG: PD-(D/E)XK nuclease family protein [Alphaproteobacteria bacterium]|nr:PD-(D/E)XK nuclease family protein [Alphaproteobacteria bacterium]
MGRKLFEGQGPRVLAAPPSAAFLDLLAQRLVEDVPNKDDPFALADAVVLLPNRRAVRGLIDAFAARAPAVTLLPSIKPLGDLDDDPDIWGPAALDLAIPPAIDPVRRRLHLAALLRGRDAAEGGAADPARAIAAADELAKLLDAAAASDGIDWSKLDTLVAEADLAAHWRRSVDFLQIVATYWPQHLADEGLADPGARRNTLIDALAEEWTRTPPSGPVVIAGSTGSLPAVRRLMAVVAHAPFGAVVLPGLDADMDDAAWSTIGPQHPQHGLRVTLEALGVSRRDVATLAGADEDDAAAARRVLVREALVPADATADWLARLTRAGGDDLAMRALAGLSRVAADTEEDEATVAALALRAALEVPGKTAALVTPDRGLARRAAAKLARWGVTVPVSSGAPLRETSVGVLLSLIADLGADPDDPRALAALVRNDRVGLDLDPAQRAIAQAAVLDALRGPRRPGGFQAMLATCTGPAHAALTVIAEALAPVRAAMAEDTVRLPMIAMALAAAAERLARTPEDDGAGRVWAGAEGAAAVRALRTLASEGDALDAISPSAAPRVVNALIGGSPVRPDAPDHPRLAIWGPLEARLQRRDLVVLGGLNEGVWPAPPPDDPFLSRSMRAALGMVSPDARIGLAAHDFAQLACAPEVLLTRALRAGGSPTVASRWIWRLETLVAGAGKAAVAALDPDTDWRALARMLDTPRVRAPAAAPRPCPPAEARPRSLRVTQVRTLIRDPYAIYARIVLGLEQKDAIGKEPEAAERGTAIHRAIELFSLGDVTAPDAAERLAALVDQELAAAGFPADQRMTDRARLAASARVYAAWAAARAQDGGVAIIEDKGVLDLGDGLQLRCRADRIDIDPHGRAVIVDTKTGQPPTPTEVDVGFEPQLPLEAAILLDGGFEKAKARRVDALVYWRFGGAEPGPSHVGGGDPEGLAALTKKSVRDLLVKYLDPEQPFLSKPRVKFANTYSDYDALARRKEWMDAGSGE